MSWLRTDLLPWLPPLLTVVGWAVVSWQTNRRERRKEVRGIVDAIKRRVVDVSSTAETYMCGASRDQAAEAEVKAGLDEIEIELGRLPFYRKRPELVTAMARFADACTGGDFESARWSSRLRSSVEAQEILRTRNWLVGVLEERLKLDFG